MGEHVSNGVINWTSGCFTVVFCRLDKTAWLDALQLAKVISLTNFNAFFHSTTSNLLLFLKLSASNYSLTEAVCDRSLGEVEMGTLEYCSHPLMNLKTRCPQGQAYTTCLQKGSLLLA